MIFDYLRMVHALDTIDIPDIGNTCINACNDVGQEWYLSISTHQGWTTVIEFGPLLVDADEIGSYFTYDMHQHEYSDAKIRRTIDKFINNPKRIPTQVFEVMPIEAAERLEAVKPKL